MSGPDFHQTLWTQSLAALILVDHVFLGRNYFVPNIFWNPNKIWTKIFDQNFLDQIILEQTSF